MISLKIALRSLLRRKRRMIAIGILVMLGTILITFGQTFSRSAGFSARRSIIDNLTGNFIIYSGRSREVPSPFSFQTPLPNIRNIDGITSYLDQQEGVADYVPMAQNYAILRIQTEETTEEVPLIFYAVQPGRYRRFFQLVEMQEGSFFGTESAGPSRGVVISEAQRKRYEEDYGVRLSPGDEVTILGITQGGSVNALPSQVIGVFTPRVYRNVFDYINYMDMTSYSDLFNFTGVSSESLPEDFRQGLSASSEEDIFALGEGESGGSLDVESLETETLSGFTMIAVKVTDDASADEVMEEIRNADLGVKVASWEDASGGFAQISTALQAFMYVATGLIFLIVILIFMNTLIINIIERTGEIGTLRAIGGEKSFIRTMFLSETLFLNSIFASAGIIISLLLTWIFNERGVPLPDTIAQFLVGGGRLPLIFTIRPYLEAVAAIFLVSVLATLYPVRVATKISPLQAMNAR